MRSIFDYDCIAYMSAAETNLKQLDVLQAQALRICSGSFKSSPVSSLQVEMGEMPLDIRRMKLMLAYWINIRGQKVSHPVKSILTECWEHTETNIRSFGWIGDAEAKNRLTSNTIQQYSINILNSSLVISLAKC